jgi:hypothetical protein
MASSSSDDEGAVYEVAVGESEAEGVFPAIRPALRDYHGVLAFWGVGAEEDVPPPLLDHRPLAEEHRPLAPVCLEDFELTMAAMLDQAEDYVRTVGQMKSFAHEDVCKELEEKGFNIT